VLLPKKTVRLKTALQLQGCFADPSFSFHEQQEIAAAIYVNGMLAATPS
jgi:hypothetical protein